MTFRDSFAWKAGCFLGATGVVFGAFGSHGLAKIIKNDPKKLDSWKVAAQYQLIHSLALLVIGSAGASPLAAKLIAGGTTAFSGSIYLLTLSPALKVLGPVTPLGGVFMIAGWVAMLF